MIRNAATTSLAILLVALGGCNSMKAGLQRRIDNYVANTPEFDPKDVNTFVSDQNAVMADFARLAGVDPKEGGEWRQVVDAGIHYSDIRCDRFMDSLFWFNRVRETTSRQIQFTGAAASAALAVVEASKNAIGLTPLGFALLDQTVNNLGAGLLFSLNPSTVRVLVEKQQEAYLQALSPSYTSKTIALRVIQNYAALCLPPSIETEVERSIANEEYAPKVIAPALPPAADDLTPDAFAFPSATSQAPSATVVSAPIRVTGIGAPAPISISSGGEYQIGAGPWTSFEGTVAPNWPVRVRVTSSANAGEAVSTTLDIGGVQGTFSVTTAADGAIGTAEAGAAAPPAAPPAPATPDLPPAPPVTITPEQNAVPSPQPTDDGGSSR